MSSIAPIALFVYNRASHTEETLKFLLQNAECRQSDLTVFSDGPRTTADEMEVQKTRSLFENIDGFRSVKVVHRNGNWGLARSVISGVSEILKVADRIIVLEDDMVTSPKFLKYMNAALDRYAHEDRVGSIHAYMYPIENLPEFFFMRGGDCWGWGTWRDRWRHFEPDARKLLRLLNQGGLLQEFNKTGGDQMVRMLTDQARGKNSSWFIRWHASLFLNGKLTLQPGRSFVHNIGIDNSGTHCKTTDRFNVVPQDSFETLPTLDITENRQAIDEIRNFFERNQNSPWYRRFARLILNEFYLRKVLHYG
jgi:hypothetical protein